MRIFIASSLTIESQDVMTCTWVGPQYGNHGPHDHSVKDYQLHWPHEYIYCAWPFALKILFRIHRVSQSCNLDKVSKPEQRFQNSCERIHLQEHKPQYQDLEPDVVEVQ